ncbi:MAG: RluA family pseudouridine synthase [Thermomicrobiales bacterium]|nr:RluA family pseudouridine synthase [Thermomicrobiales bacterium]
MISIIPQGEDQQELIELFPQREHLGTRLDKYVADELPELSRTYLQQLITDGSVLVDGLVRRPSFKVTPGEVVTVELPEVEETELLAEDIPLDVVYEDADILMINKPAGLVVHPAAGHSHGTLVNAVLYHAPEISIQGSTRPGIIHRLDKDTSGIMVIAKSDRAQTTLVEQWQARQVEKKYLALVTGVVEEDSATIDAPIGRSSANRQQMTTTRSGRDAVTHFIVVERFSDCTLLDVTIETGRTHQIRVHLAFIGHPVVADGLYGNKVSARVAERLDLHRQFLHAQSLSFAMPGSGEKRTFAAPLPADLQHVLDQLREESADVNNGV